MREIFSKSARNPQFSRRLSKLTIQVSLKGTRMKEGDSIGVVRRHENESRR